MCYSTKATPPHPIVNSSFSTELPELIKFNQRVTDAKSQCNALEYTEFFNKLTALIMQLDSEGRPKDAALLTHAKSTAHTVVSANFSNKLTALAVQLRNEDRFDDAALVDRTAGLIYVF